MAKQNGKILVVSLHINGGCFQYGNELFSRLNVPCDIYVPNVIDEPLKIPHVRRLLFWKRPTPLRLMSLALFLVKMVVLGWLGHYKAMLLAGFTSWDYYIMKAWKLTGRPSMFIVHDGIMHDGEQDNANQRKLTYIMRHATELVFLSNFVRENVRRQLGIDKPSVIIPHGLIDYGNLPASKENERPNVLFLGRVGKYKGVETLLEATKQLPPGSFGKLIIAGKWMYEPPKKLPSNVEVINRWLSNDEILTLISNSDIMVFPYKEASQSGVATLAVNYLKPSVVTTVGALPEQFPANGATLIEADDPSGLASAIQELCSDRDKRAAYTAELAKFRETLSWDAIADKLNEHLKSFWR